MTSKQKYIAWGTGILLWVFGLSIFLSTLNFGYLDLPTVKHMLWILSPLLVVAAVLLYVFKRQAGPEKKEQALYVKRTLAEETR
jgi:hypothetical protein